MFLKFPNGGIAEYTKKYPQSVHAAYPGLDYQVEVYDPNPGTAAGLLVSGQLSHLGNARPTPSTAGVVRPTQTSDRELRALAKSLGHSIYWLGPKKNYTYEMRKSPSGNVSVRYLPPGVAVGTRSRT